MDFLDFGESVAAFMCAAFMRFLAAAPTDFADEYQTL
jgi:hypothetical protein